MHAHLKTVVSLARLRERPAPPPPAGLSGPTTVSETHAKNP